MIDPDTTKTTSLLRAESILSQIPFPRLRQLFVSPIDGSEVELNISQFVSLFHKHISDSVKEKDLIDLFARVDANANESLSFFECIMYIQLGTAGHRKMRDEKMKQKFVELPQFPLKRNTSFHKELIVRLLYDPLRHRIYSASIDGHVKSWDSTTLKFERTIHNPPDKNASITDITVSPDFVELVVGTVSREIYVYNLTIMQLDRVYKGKRRVIKGKPETYRKKKPLLDTQILRKRIYGEIKVPHASYSTSATYEMPMYVVEKMDTVPVRLSTHYHKKMDTTLLYVAGEDGYIRMIDMNPHGTSMSTATGGATGSMNAAHTMAPEGVTGIQSNSVVPLKKSSTPFEGWISKMIVATNIHLLIVTSWDTNIKLFSLDTLKLVRTLQGHKTPIYSAAYSPELKLLCTCGRDKFLYLWNPFISSPLQLLEGHQFPVIDIVFNPKDKQLISLGVDKTIKVWDIRMFRCVQTFKEKQQFHPEDKLAALFFDTQEDRLVTGSTCLHSYDMQRSRALFRSDYLGHIHEIRTVLYNPKYHQAIVADSTFVFAWDCITGALIFKYKVDGEIVGACLDDKKRRVIVSTASGSVIMYNYINGQELKDLKNNHPSSKEVSSLCHISLMSQDIRIVAGGGMEKKILIWSDLSEDLEEKILRKVPHKSKLRSSIISTAHFRDTLIVGEENGTVNLIDFQTGFARAFKTFEESLGFDNCIGELVCYMMEPPVGRTPTISSSESTQTDVIGASSQKALATPSYASVSLPASICQTHRQVEDILVLPRIDPICVTCYANGTVTFWNAVNLTHLFSFVAHPKNESINCMCSDKDNHNLILGVADGSILVYDISQIVTHPTKKPHVMANHISFQSQHRVHSKTVTSICFMDSSQMILSGSQDCTVSIINMQGQQIGFFGQSHLWDIKNPETFGKCSLGDLLSTKNNGPSLLSFQRSASSESILEERNVLEVPTAQPAEHNHSPPEKLTEESLEKGIQPAQSSETIQSMSVSKVAERLRNSLAPDESNKRLELKKEEMRNLESQVEDLLLNSIGQVYKDLETRYQVSADEAQSSEALRRGVQDDVEDETRHDKSKRLFTRQFNTHNYTQRLNAFRRLERIELPPSMRFDE
mmetsp:Transcript_4346/g.16372  ORF Transcript_4346/g.16372 Transcript_4346/m.16372 type:complete len:1110 (-) Transcript_4346:1843-5172(-)